LEPLLSRHLLTTFGPLQYVLWMPMINIVRDIQEQRGFNQNYTVGTMLYLIT